MTWKLSSCERLGEARASQTDRQTGLPWLLGSKKAQGVLGFSPVKKHLDLTDLS